MPRISQLTSLTTVDSGDQFAIVDVSASVTKKTTKSDLLKDTATYLTGSNKVVAGNIDFSTLPKFKAYRSTPLTSTASNNTAIVFDTEIFDVGSNFSTSTGLFTAPYDCTMVFYARVFCETAGRAFISPRGTAGPSERTPDLQMTGIRRVDGTFVVPMTVGQTFGVNIWLDVAVAIGGSVDTQLSGWII